MKNVRVWFKKMGTAKYISHLDLNRCMARAVHKAQLPVWYSKGFNPRASLVFALPLSLGVSGERECVDLRLEDDDFDVEKLAQLLNSGLPDDIPVFDVTEPVEKPGHIAFASYEIFLDTEGNDPAETAEKFRALLQREALVVPRHTKRGSVDFDVRPYLDKISICPRENGVFMEMTLPAGSVQNVNPQLFLDAAKKYSGLDFYAELCRTGMYDGNQMPFE